MHDALTQLGVGGIFAVLVIKQVLDFVGKKRNGNSCPYQPFRNAGQMEGQIGELHQWHQPGYDGQQAWKNGKLAEAIAQMQQTLIAQADALRKQTETLKDLRRDVRACAVAGPPSRRQRSDSDPDT